MNYAGLSSNKYHNLAEKYTKGKAAGIMTFGVKSSKLSGKAAGALFQDSLKLIVRLVNIGDSKSLVCHQASTTHSQLSDEELLAAGVSPDMIADLGFGGVYQIDTSNAINVGFFGNNSNGGSW